MFKNPFSFNGRIRRMEYGLSILIHIVFYIAALALIDSSDTSGIGATIGVLMFIPMLWFLWAQGAKRCHDIDRSGWMQIIPFYGFFLLFQGSDDGTNSYGPNPKYPDQIDVLDSETLDGHLKD